MQLRSIFACFPATIAGGALYAGGAWLGGVGAYAATPLVGLLTCWVHTDVRRAFKKHHGITAVERDRLLTAFCDPCAMCQEVRELELKSAHAAAVAAGPYVGEGQDPYAAPAMQPNGMQKG